MTADSLTTITFTVLLVTQTLHLLHHRLAKRHISFAEVTSSGLLCVPLTAGLPPLLLAGAHLSLAGVQVVGSLWIHRLSPDWKR
jgi:hypothetical protein